MISSGPSLKTPKRDNMIYLRPEEGGEIRLFSVLRR